MSDENFAALRSAVAEAGAITRGEIPAARRTVIDISTLELRVDPSSAAAGDDAPPEEHR